MTVPVQLAPAFKPGSPTKLFDGRYFSAVQQRSYNVSRDDQRVIMIKDAPAAQGANLTPASIIVVLNWLEELKARVRAAK